MRTCSTRFVQSVLFRCALIPLFLVGISCATEAQPITSIPGSAFSFNNGGVNSNFALVSQNSQYVFVTNQSSGTISVLNMASDGTLTQNSIIPSAQFAPCGMATNVAGDHLYVTGFASAAVLVYSIAANGSLAQVQSLPLPSGASPLAGIVSVSQASGEFVYVNNGLTTVSAFKVDPAGTLTQIGVFDTGGQSTGGGYYGSPRIAACPGHIFALNDAVDTVAAFNIQADGSLVAAAGSPFSLPSASSGAIAASPLGDAMYAALGDDISKFTINANGSLTLVGTAPTGMGGSAGIDGMAVDQSGAYVIGVDPSAGSDGLIAVLDTSTGFNVAGSPVASDTTQFAAGAAFDPNFKYFITGNANLTNTDVSVYTWNLGKPVRLILNPSKVNAGDSSTGKVQLLKPAPVGGATVDLSNNNPTAVTMPNSVFIPEGQKSATFNVDTDASITVPTPVDITATLGPDSDTATLTILPIVAAVELQYQYFPFPWLPTHAEVGGGIVNGRVVLSLPAPDPDGRVITLTSLLPGIASLIPSITVQAGQTTAYFPVFTKPVALDTDVVITGAYGSSVAFAIDTVLAPTPSSVLITPTSVPGGTSATGTVYLNGVAPSSGLHVLLSSDQAPYVTVPSFVDIQPGKTYGNFPITTTAVPNNITANITASYNGVSASGALKVTSAGLASLVINPTSVPGGTQASGIVTLQKPASVNGADVDLSFSPPGNYPASIPASVHINGGQSQAIFVINTTATGANTLVPIQARLRGTSSTKNASLMVLASGVASITITPTVMHLNTYTTSGYVFLNGTAPAGGAVVTLTIVGGGHTSPSGSLTIPQGMNRGQFVFIAPSVVPPGGFVTVTATYPAGVSKSTNVMIIP